GAGLSRRGRADVRHSSPVRFATYLEKPDSKESGFFSFTALKTLSIHFMSCNVGLFTLSSLVEIHAVSKYSVVLDLCITHMPALPVI
ncbi:hypothetical protein ACFO1C_002890, partial [Photobacterium damselae]